ncbi:unnamed protein product [Rotaria socialis]|uniref:Potassium channel tetramerisation-type BTB domain-containing protein n=1 Tax=Rotaria socialis TaxID=392032 RepID=A0A817RBP8_9BILA|nr:unnamed protein product [Rotaria socialis]CAF3673879.1 unnamed protein product [Rotaria socialis]CAF4159987.1 unnamed protein product [Rotaria socialis]CAF4602538.1 unnamed protein product [Rotaria socialis]
MTHEENFNQDLDLVKINDSSQNYPIIIYARQLNQYYHTLLGNPFQRLNYYDSSTGQYCFCRTPGIINYIITYYLQQGCLLTEVHYPPEILYDELVFFGFNIQIIYDIVSNCITINYYIPSGKYRRAFWFTFDSDISKYKFYLTRTITSLITICSVITSLTFLEIANNLFTHHDQQRKFLIKKALVIEILILTFFYFELTIRYFIRPKIQQTTVVLMLINFVSLLPIALFLFIWPIPSAWLYNLLVLQLAARIVRSVRLSSYAYQITHALTEQLSIYVESFQSIALINLFFALLILAFEQMSSVSNRTNDFRSLSEIIWISFNAFTALGEGTNRPLTSAGLIIEFLTCFIGVLTIPQFAQIVYTIVSNTIDKQKINDEKRKRTHLVMIEDEHGNKAIGQVNVDDQRNESLPEILIQKDEF